MTADDIPDGVHIRKKQKTYLRFPREFATPITFGEANGTRITPPIVLQDLAYAQGMSRQDYLEL